MITRAPSAPAAADLMTRARSGDQAAWQQLIEPLQPDILRLAYLVLRDPAEAADIQQETLLRAWLKLDQYDPDRPLRPWLLQIAINLARNRRRSLRRAWRRLNQMMRGEVETTAPAASATTAAQERASRLWQAVQQLPAKAQAVVYLRYFLDCSEEEAAAALEIPKGTVKSRTSRALNQLRGIIQRDFPDLEADFVHYE